MLNYLILQHNVLTVTDWKLLNNQHNPCMKIASWTSLSRSCMENMSQDHSVSATQNRREYVYFPCNKHHQPSPCEKDCIIHYVKPSKKNFRWRTWFSQHFGCIMYNYVKITWQATAYRILFPSVFHKDYRET